MKRHVLVEGRDPDPLPRAVARATLWCAAALALVTVPLAVSRAGPDWLAIPIVIVAILSAFVVVSELVEIAWHRRARPPLTT